MKHSRSNSAGIISFIIIIILVIVTAGNGLSDIILFKSLEYKYKKEVKQIIKAGIPDEKLELFVFHKSILEQETSGFKWMKKNEFRYKNEMYDIIKQDLSGDSIHFYCFHDLKESGLFAGLDKSISDFLSGNPGRKDNIKSTFNLLNKFFEEEPGFASLIIYPDNSIYPSPKAETVLNGYCSILLPPPKHSYYL